VLAGAQLDGLVRSAGPHLNHAIIDGDQGLVGIRADLHIGPAHGEGRVRRVDAQRVAFDPAGDETNRAVVQRVMRHLLAGLRIEDEGVDDDLGVAADEQVRLVDEADSRGARPVGDNLLAEQGRRFHRLRLRRLVRQAAGDLAGDPHKTADRIARLDLRLHRSGRRQQHGAKDGSQQD